MSGHQLDYFSQEPPRPREPLWQIERWGIVSLGLVGLAWACLLGMRFLPVPEPRPEGYVNWAFRVSITLTFVGMAVAICGRVRDRYKKLAFGGLVAHVVDYPLYMFGYAAAVSGL